MRISEDKIHILTFNKNPQTGKIAKKKKIPPCPRVVSGPAPLEPPCASPEPPGATDKSVDRPATHLSVVQKQQGAKTSKNGGIDDPN